MTGTKLFDHVRSMLYVTIPAAFISLGLYWVVGNRYISGEINMETVNSILQTLSSNFNLSPLTLIPPLLVVLLSVRKVPAVMALMISFLTASFFASLPRCYHKFHPSCFIQIVQYRVGNCWQVATHGGINSMMNTVVIIWLELLWAGFWRTQVLTLFSKLLFHYIKTPRA